MLGFVTRNARWLGAGFLLTFFSAMGQTFFIGLSQSSIRDALGLSNSAMAGIYAIATLISAGLFLQLGKTVDRYPPRRVAAGVMIGLALACLMIAGAQNMAMVLIGFTALRLFGQSMMTHIAVTTTGRWFNAQRGRALSLVTMGFPASQALIAGGATALLPLLGFRWIWAISAGAILLFALPVITTLLSQDRTPQSADDAVKTVQRTAARDWRRAELLRDPTFFILISCVLCTGAMSTAVFFHQTHLIGIKNWTPALFGAGFSVYAATQVFARIGSGYLIDAFGARALLPFHLIPMALGLILGALLVPAYSVFIMLALMAMTAALTSTLLGALWPELYGLKYLGEIRAMTFAIVVVATALSPLITGYFIDQGVAFTGQMLVMAGICFTACAALWLLQGRLAAIAGRV